jgi:integrase
VAGYRTVTLPPFAVETLLRSKMTMHARNPDLVFPSSGGTIRDPHNVQRQWREARGAAGFDWVVPHAFRKSVATFIDQELTTAHAASQLGHSKAAMTAKHEVQRAVVAPDVSHVLERFGSNQNGG